MAGSKSYYIAVQIGGRIYRSWAYYADASLSYAKALAKLPGVEGVLLIGEDDSKPRFTSGIDLSDSA